MLHSIVPSPAPSVAGGQVGILPSVHFCGLLGLLTLHAGGLLSSHVGLLPFEQYIVALVEAQEAIPLVHEGTLPAEHDGVVELKHVGEPELHVGVPVLEPPETHDGLTVCCDEVPVPAPPGKSEEMKSESEKYCCGDPRLSTKLKELGTPSNGAYVFEVMSLAS